HALKGSLVSVMVLGIIIIISWAGVWMLFLSRDLKERCKMNMHKYEKVWLMFGSGTLLVFLIVVGISAFYMGYQPPSCAVTINPERAHELAPFDETGLEQIGDNVYPFTILASAFNYDVGTDDK